jgi:hypothetical protein
MKAGWNHPVMSKKLSRNERIGAGSLIVAIISLPLALLLPEVRQWVHLEKKTAIGDAAIIPTPTIPENPKPTSTTVVNPPVKTKQRLKTINHHGDNNVPGNIVTGNGNVTGHDNQVNSPAPIFVGPGSIGITGGIVSNPTVNNFGPLARRIRSDSRDDVIAILKDKAFKIDIAYVPGDETFQFANDMYGLVKEAGWQIGGFDLVALQTPWRGVRVDYYESGSDSIPLGARVTVPAGSPAEALIRALMKAGIRNISVHPNEEDPRDSIRLLVAPYPG